MSKARTPSRVRTGFKPMKSDFRTKGAHRLQSWREQGLLRVCGNGLLSVRGHSLWGISLPSGSTLGLRKSCGHLGLGIPGIPPGPGEGNSELEAQEVSASSAPCWLCHRKAGARSVAPSGSLDEGKFRVLITTKASLLPTRSKWRTVRWAV